MGSWGIGAFENDDAADWAWTLEDADDWSPVLKVFNEVLEAGEEFLDANVAQEALAACETIARLKGGDGEKTPFSEAADQWVASHASLKDTAPIDEALASIDLILSPPSELLDLWSESDEFEGWRASVLQLRERVRA